MDEETIMRAKLLTAVVCGVIDYYVMAQARLGCGAAIRPQQEAVDKSRASLNVAIENLIDVGLE